jgi:hypothetical protein
MFAEDFPRRPMRCLVAIKRDGARQPALALERPPEKRFGCRDIPLGAEQEIDPLSLFVDRTIEVSPAAFDLGVGFIDPPRGASPACEAVPAFFEFGDVTRYPAHDHRMDQANSPLGHHFHEISKAELEPQIPADAGDDDLPVEMAALEKIINAQHPGSLPPKTSFQQICPASAVCTRAVDRAVESRFRNSGFPRDAPYEQHDGSCVEEGSGRVDRSFEVFRQPSVSIDPRKEAFDNPSGRQDHEADLIGDLPHDFDDDLRGVLEPLVVVAAMLDDKLEPKMVRHLEVITGARRRRIVAALRAM